MNPNAPEADVKREVKKLLQSYGAYWYMVVPGGFGRRGVPDFLVCHNGRFLAVETKAKGICKPSPFQAQEMEAIQAAGGTSMVTNARNIDELERWLERTKDFDLQQWLRERGK